MNDRQRWNQKYTQGSHGSAVACHAINDLARFLPTSGRALDVAGGAGRHAVWLAKRGLEVTLADVSDVGLQVAANRASQADCDINIVQTDLRTNPLPRGPWDVILSVHFLWRPLFVEFASGLAVGGKLIVIQPTRSNLQRHAKPPAAFLLEVGELPTLVAGLQVEHYEEGWHADGQHQAVIVARRDG